MQRLLCISLNALTSGQHKLHHLLLHHRKLTEPLIEPLAELKKGEINTQAFVARWKVSKYVRNVNLLVAEQNFVFCPQTHRRTETQTNSQSSLYQRAKN